MGFLPFMSKGFIRAGALCIMQEHISLHLPKLGERARSLFHGEGFEKFYQDTARIFKRKDSFPLAHLDFVLRPEVIAAAMKRIPRQIFLHELSLCYKQGDQP